MSLYSKYVPPVIKHNFGTNAWPNITTTSLPTIVIYNSAGVVIPVDTGSMTRITGTPIWYYAVGDRVLGGIPDAGALWAYVVLAGVGGPVVAEGTLEILNSAGTVGPDSITSHRFLISSSIQLPSSVSNPKSMPVKFEAYTANGQTAILDSASLTISGVVIDAAMTNTAGLWQYVWILSYDTPPAIHDLTLVATKGGVSTTYHTTVETFRAKEFNAVRLSSGIVS